MPLKTSINYSPNFNPKKRSKKEIKFIIIHYTGMKSEKAAIDRLTSIQSQVSSHYFISKKNILGHSDIAPDRKRDPGEKFPCEYLAKKKLTIWHNIKQKELKNLRKKKCNKIEKYKFSKNLIKIGYSSKNLVKATKAFQRRFRPLIIDGQIDQECFKISKKLI